MYLSMNACMKCSGPYSTTWRNRYSVSCLTKASLWNCVLNVVLPVPMIILGSDVRVNMAASASLSVAMAQ